MARLATCSASSCAMCRWDSSAAMCIGVRPSQSGLRDGDRDGDREGGGAGVGESERGHGR